MWRCVQHRPGPGEAGGSGPGLELRVILRDANPEVMDQYLTNGSRSIPIVIALDENFQEMGHWGPAARPSCRPGSWPIGYHAQGRALPPGPQVVRAGSRRDDAAGGAGGGRIFGGEGGVEALT